MARYGFGYEFVNGRLIRIDSQFIHAETVKPVLMILNDYPEQQAEFLNAHEHYLSGDLKASIMCCTRAFEGMMKSICNSKGWEFNPKKSTATPLIYVCKENGLFSDGTGEHLHELVKTLESGLPSIRNDKAGHGNDKAVEIPQHLAKYALHLTAVNLMYLNDCCKAE